MKVVISTLAGLVLALGCSTDAKTESGDNTLVVSCETVDEPGGDAGAGSGSATEVCETCECEDCDGEEEYEEAMCAAFPEDCPTDPPVTDAGPVGLDAGSGSGSGSGSGLPFAPTTTTTNVPDDIIMKCSQVGRMTWTETFNCRDFTTWFLRCLNDKGHTGTGLSMFCKDCDTGKPTRGHRIPIVLRDGNYCPLEPQREGGGIAASCCKSTKSGAESCAHDQYCDGLFPDRSTPRPSYAGCEKSSKTPRTCSYCLNESCTEEERREVCELIEHPDDPDEDCKDEATNGDCTACCATAHPNRGPSFYACLGPDKAACASKPSQ